MIMGKEKEEARKEYEQEKMRKMTRHVDGRRFYPTGTAAAIGLILEDSESEEERLVSPPPAPRATSFANILIEAKTCNDTSLRGEPAAEEDRIQPERARRHVQLLTEPVTYVLIPEDKEEQARREEGIESARSRVRTAVSLCQKNHIQLVCHWSYSDPVNRKGTWRMQLADYRRNTVFFDNGIQDHKDCTCKKRSYLLEILGKRMAYAFDLHEDKFWNARADDKRKENWKNGVTKKQSPPLWQIVRELGPLTAFVMGTGDASEPDDTSDKDNRGKNEPDQEDDTNNKNDIGSRSNKGGKGDRAKESKEETVKARQEAQKKAQLASLERKMKDKAERKAADEVRMKRQAELQAGNQRMTNEAAIWDADPKAAKRRGLIPPENYGKESRIKDKKQLKFDQIKGEKLEKEREEKLKQSKSKLRKAVITVLTEQERGELKSIQAAQQEQAHQLDQAEWEDDERQQQLAVEELEGEPEEEEEDDEDLVNAINEAICNASPEQEPTKKKSEEDTQKKTPRSKLSRVEFASGSPNDAETSTSSRSAKEKPRKKQLKQCACPVVHDALDDSDSIKAPKSSRTPDSKTEAFVENSKQTMSYTDYLLTRTSCKTDKMTKTGKFQKQKRTSKKIDTTPKTSDKLAPTETSTAMTKNGKVYKSEDFVADSDLQNDEKGDVSLPTDRLNAEKVLVETASTEVTLITTEQDSDISEQLIETTTVTVETQEDNGSIERIEVTEATKVSSNSSEQGEEVTVEHTTHTQTATALNVPKQGLSCSSPPPSPHREPQEVNTSVKTLGIEIAVTPPGISLASPCLPGADSNFSSSRKRKRSATLSEPQPEPEVESDHSDTSPLPKKRKTIPPFSSSVKAAAAYSTPSAPPTPEDANCSSLNSVPASSQPELPSVALDASLTSSSLNKKWKLTRSEEDGQVTSNPGGTKRVKRVLANAGAGEATEKSNQQPRDAKVEDAPEHGNDEEVETKEPAAEAEAVALEPVSIEAQNEDEDDLHSLFSGSSQATSEKGQEITDAASLEAGVDDVAGKGD